jgi:hypothetical protein
LNLLAFAYHTVASLAVLAWRTALAAKGATYRFFEHMRTITTNVVFQNWAHVLRSIVEANIRPPCTRQLLPSQTHVRPPNKARNSAYNQSLLQN